jgi:hypothetical protein
MQHGHGSASQVIASSAMLAEPQWGFCLNFRAGVRLLLISALIVHKRLLARGIFERNRDKAKNNRMLCCLLLSQGTVSLTN